MKFNLAIVVFDAPFNPANIVPFDNAKLSICTLILSLADVEGVVSNLP